ncbi:MAG: ABC transporter ATP-binding protein, partial [Anaerolineae bacterium]
GRTIVMVTHDARAASYADRVVFLKDGRIVDELKRVDGDRHQSMEAIIDVMRLLD